MLTRPSQENATGDRSYARAKRLAIELTSWPGKRCGPFETTNVMLNTPKGGILKAVKRDRSAWNLI
jgi:hypothetical protein